MNWIQFGKITQGEICESTHIWPVTIYGAEGWTRKIMKED